MQPNDSWIDGAHLYTTVSEPIEDKIVRSAKALKIKAFNSKSYKILLDAYLIREFSDIYQLKDKKTALLRIKGLGQKKIEMLLNEIELSRRASFEQYLNAMQILYVGSKNCKEIASRCSNLKEFFALDLDTLKSLNVRSRASLKAAQQNECWMYRLYSELDLSKNN